VPQEATRRGRSHDQVSHEQVSHDHGQTAKGAISPVHVVDVEKRQVRVKFGKKLNAADIEKYVRNLVASTTFEPDFSEIVDLCEVEELELTADDFLKLADQVDPFSVEAKRAFIVRTSVQNHAARMHKILRTHQKIEIFRSLAEAERWIRG
jgi:hypothetical protein